MLQTEIDNAARNIINMRDINGRVRKNNTGLEKYMAIEEDSTR